MSHRWYYNLEGAQYGPADEAEIIRRIQSAELPPGVLVCRHGEAGWQPARNHACFQVEVYPRSKVPSRPAAPPVGGPIGVFSTPPSFGQTQAHGEFYVPVERKSSKLPWVLAGATDCPVT